MRSMVVWNMVIITINSMVRELNTILRNTASYYMVMVVPHTILEPYISYGRETEGMPEVLVLFLEIFILQACKLSACPLSYPFCYPSI